MTRPKLKIALPFFYKLLETISLMCVLVLVAIPIYYWNQLPAQIPINGGKTASRAIELLLPVFGVIIYISILLLKKIPHHFNYVVKITQQNAAYQYSLGLKLMVWMNLLTLAMLAIGNYSSIQSALNSSNPIGEWIIFGLLAWMIVLTIYIVKKMTKDEEIVL
jgi:hypothetical protein